MANLETLSCRGSRVAVSLLSKYIFTCYFPCRDALLLPDHAFHQQHLSIATLLQAQPGFYSFTSHQDAKIMARGRSYKSLRTTTPTFCKCLPFSFISVFSLDLFGRIKWNLHKISALVWACEQLSTSFSWLYSVFCVGHESLDLFEHNQAPMAVSQDQLG